MTKLSRLIKERKISQKTLADKVGTSQAVICRYAQGNRQPRASTAVKIAKALDTTVEALWGEGETE